MPKWDFVCEKCGFVEERNVGYGERERQRCGREMPVGRTGGSALCSGKMRRLPHFQSLVVTVPTHFHEANAQGYTQRQFDDPQTPEERKRWDKIGVAAQRI
jgi:hypothetical protein